MKSFVKQVTRPLILLFIAAMGVLTLLSTYTINEVIQEDVAKLSEDILASKANDISSFLQARIREVESMAQLYDEQSTLEENLANMRFLSEIDKGYESLGIVDENGDKHVTTGAVFSVLEREYYHELMESDQLTMISDPVESKDNQETIVIILTKVMRNNQLAAIVSGAVNLGYIQDVMEQNNTFDFTTSLFDNQTQQVLLQSGNQAEPSYHTYAQPLNVKEDWSIQIEVPNSFFYTRLLFVDLAIVFFTIIAGFIVILLTRRTINKNVQPLEELTQTMHEVNLDNLNPIALDTSTQEIHDLAGSYNRMMQNIEELIHELEEKEKAKKDSEYKALIQQIKPHFLYNTLEMIQSMCLDYDDDKVENAIGLLATFFRTSLSNDALMIPLSSELLQVKSYLEIQLLRYRDQFEYEIINDVVNDVMFMKFTLQPLVENAIYHGIKHMNRKGKIFIHAIEKDNHVIITVKNEYESIDKEKITLLNELFRKENNHEEYSGYGLYNVNERLKLHFGASYHLNIEMDPHWVSVTCTQPIMEEE